MNMYAFFFKNRQSFHDKEKSGLMKSCTSSLNDWKSVCSLGIKCSNMSIIRRHLFLLYMLYVLNAMFYNNNTNNIVKWKTNRATASSSSSLICLMLSKLINNFFFRINVGMFVSRKLQIFNGIEARYKPTTGFKCI